MTSLMHTVTNEHANIVQALLDTGKADHNYTTFATGESALFLARNLAQDEKREYTMQRFLANPDCDIDTKNHHGLSVMDYTVS